MFSQLLCPHELRQNEIQNGIDLKSAILTETKFQTGIRFSCEHGLPETKRISAGLLNIAFNAHVGLKLNAGMDFPIGHFERNKISFRAI